MAISLSAAQVEENLASVESTIVDFGNIPVSHLAELSKLPPEQQSEALLKAEQIAQAKGKKRNASHIAQAVQEIKQPPVDTVESAALQEPEPSANVQNLTSKQMSALLQAISRRASRADALHSQPSLKLKQMIKDAKQIIKNAKWELNQRRHPEYK